jgi:RHS repeat-associated protein
MDANGNVSARDGDATTWTSYNYLSTTYAGGGESVSFYYGPNRQRFKTVYIGSVGTETTYHVGKLLEKVINGSTTDYRHYIFAGKELVAISSRMNSGTNTLRYALEDHQSSFASILTSTGTIDVNESFTAYGLRRSGNTWSGAPTGGDETAINNVSRWGYTGQTVLGVSMGLNHMNGRVEDSIIGRFLSPDPNVPDPGNTQSWNRYTYVNNNPVTMVDPSGFIPGGDCSRPGYCPGDIDHAGSGGVGSLNDGSSGGFSGTATDVDDELFGPSDTGALTAWFNAAASAITATNSWGGASGNAEAVGGTSGGATVASQSSGAAQGQTYVCGTCAPAQDQTVVNNWLTGNYGADPQTGQTISGNGSGSIVEGIAAIVGGTGISMDAINMVSDTDIMKAGTELFSRVGTFASVGLDVYQAVNSTSNLDTVFHSVDAIVDVGVSRLGYVGFGISVLWTLDGGAKGIYQTPNPNPSYVFPY